MRFSDKNVWQRIKLNEYADFLQGLTYSPNNVSTTGRLVLRSSNIQNSKLAFDDNVYVNMNIPAKISTKENDVLMCVRNGSKNLVGKTALITKEFENLAWGAFMNIIRPKDGKTLLFHFLNSQYFKNQIKADLNTATVNQITIGTLNQCKISIPLSEIEKDKLCIFFNLLDQRIDTQSKIIEDLELFKNMISYKILYDDKTACYKPLSSFSELKNGYAFKSNTYSSKGDYQIVTIANVSGNRYIDLTSSNKILNIPNDIQSHQILKINDILISLTGNVGRVSYCNKLNCLLNQRVGLLSIKNKDLIEYIFQCIHNKIFEKTMISRGQGVAQLNIGKYDVESFEIPVYSQDRMNTISEVLKLIDFKIIKEKDILELYKKQKAYLLKNMFI